MGVNRFNPVQKATSFKKSKVGKKLFQGIESIESTPDTQVS